MSGPGASDEALQKQAKLYEAFQNEQVAKGARKPLGEEALIFDEVKVVSRLLWNSRSQEVIGLAMSPEDMSSLHDIYLTLSSNESPQQATYMLQFLWRDLTSCFDIVGPYYSSSESLKSKFIVACVYETMVFQLHHFQTSVLICDGASSNMTALKTTTGTSGAYGISSTLNQRHTISSPRFENPRIWYTG